MAEIVTTITKALPARRWSRPYAIVLSDVVTDANLRRDGVPYKYLQNVGTSGLVMIAWGPNTTTFDLVDIYLGQGVVMEMGCFLVHAKTTGTAVGVALRGFVGISGESEL